MTRRLVETLAVPAASMESRDRGSDRDAIESRENDTNEDCLKPMSEGSGRLRSARSVCQLGCLRTSRSIQGLPLI